MRPKNIRPQAFGERAITLAEPQNNKKQHNKSGVFSEFNRPFLTSGNWQKNETKSHAAATVVATGSTATTTAATLPAYLLSTTGKKNTN